MGTGTGFPWRRKFGAGPQCPFPSPECLAAVAPEGESRLFCYPESLCATRRDAE